MHMRDQAEETRPLLCLSPKHMTELVEVKHGMLHEGQEAQNSL